MLGNADHPAAVRAHACRRRGVAQGVGARRSRRRRRLHCRRLARRSPPRRLASLRCWPPTSSASCSDGAPPDASAAGSDSGSASPAGAAPSRCCAWAATGHWWPRRSCRWSTPCCPCSPRSLGLGWRRFLLLAAIGDLLWVGLWTATGAGGRAAHRRPRRDRRPVRRGLDPGRRRHRRGVHLGPAPGARRLQPASGGVPRSVIVPSPEGR